MKIRPALLVFPLLSPALLLVSGCNPFAPQPAEEEVLPEEQTREEELIGGQKDENGCLIAAGYSWCDAKQKCLRTWEESCEEAETPPEYSAEKEALELVFREKYNKAEGDVIVSIQRLEGDYARGGVRFGPFDQPGGGGGLFLAYRENGQWKLAFDGNGMFPCAPLNELGFPPDMHEGCFQD